MTPAGPCREWRSALLAKHLRFPFQRPNGNAGFGSAARAAILLPLIVAVEADTTDLACLGKPGAPHFVAGALLAYDAAVDGLRVFLDGYLAIAVCAFPAALGVPDRCLGEFGIVRPLAGDRTEHAPAVVAIDRQQRSALLAIRGIVEKVVELHLPRLPYCVTRS